jgi:hypothetical protein
MINGTQDAKPLIQYRLKGANTFTVMKTWILQFILKLEMADSSDMTVANYETLSQNERPQFKTYILI